MEPEEDPNAITSLLRLLVPLDKTLSGLACWLELLSIPLVKAEVDVFRLRDLKI